MYALRRTLLCAVLMGAPLWAANGNCDFSFGMLAAVELNQNVVVETYRSLLEVFAGKLRLSDLKALRDGKNPFLLADSADRDLHVLRKQLKTFQSLLEAKGLDTPEVRSSLIDELAKNIEGVEANAARTRKLQDYWFEVPKSSGQSSSLNFITPVPGKTLLWRLKAVPLSPEVFWVDKEGIPHLQQTEKILTGFAKLRATPDGSALLVASAEGWYHQVPWNNGPPDWSKAISVKSPRKKESWFRRTFVSEENIYAPSQAAIVGSDHPRLVALVEEQPGKEKKSPRHRFISGPDIQTLDRLQVFDPKTRSVTQATITFPTQPEWATHLFSIPEKDQLIILSLRETERGESPERLLRRYQLEPEGKLREVEIPMVWPVKERLTKEQLAMTTLTPGGHHLIIARSNKVTCYQVNSDRNFTVAEGDLDHFQLAAAPDGNSIAITTGKGDERRLRVIDLVSGKPTLETKIPPVNNEIAYGPDSETIYMQMKGRVLVINLAQRLTD